MTATHLSANSIAGATQTTVYDSLGRTLLACAYVLTTAPANALTSVATKREKGEKGVG